MSRTRVGIRFVSFFFRLNDGRKSRNGALRLSVVYKCLCYKISWHGLCIISLKRFARFCERMLKNTNFCFCSVSTDKEVFIQKISFGPVPKLSPALFAIKLEVNIY